MNGIKHELVGPAAAAAAAAGYPNSLLYTPTPSWMSTENFPGIIFVSIDFPEFKRIRACRSAKQSNMTIEHSSSINKLNLYSCRSLLNLILFHCRKSVDLLSESIVYTGGCRSFKRRNVFSACAAYIEYYC